MANVTLTIFLDRELRARFKEYCKINHVSMSQALGNHIDALLGMRHRTDKEHDISMIPQMLDGGKNDF